MFNVALASTQIPPPWEVVLVTALFATKLSSRLIVGPEA
jgi:hypothetical protein